MKKALINIPKYSDFKRFNVNELESLAFSIRHKLIELAKEKPIHLSSNLGIVELSIAILFLYNSPNDKIIYDTGHQSYVHKLLTDRNIDDIREIDGCSGFQNPNESIHDFVSAGHSSTSLSLASGAKEHWNNNKNNFVVIIGDASIANGLAYEALNNIAFNKTPMLIIINDNEMSISKSVGRMSVLLSRMKFGEKIDIDKNNIKNKINFRFSNNKKTIKTAKDFFESMGFCYFGMFDGNNLKETLNVIKKAKQEAKFRPTILHLKTKKGYGLKQAELDFEGQFHSLKLSENENKLTYGKCAANILSKFVKINDNFLVLNPAMILPSGFLEFSKKYPKHIEDTGISESHTITKACGIALANKKVFVNIYSSFLQRGYDNLLHDVARTNSPITFLIDRADLSYQDGNTHHGIYDIGFVKTFNNAIITSPSNSFELEKLICFSWEYNGPFFIRYSKDECPIIEKNNATNFDFGDWIWIFKKLGAKKCIISYGNIINELVKEINDSHDFDLINAIFVTGYRKQMILKILNKYKHIFVVEKVVDNGCLGNDLIQIAFEHKINVKITKINIKDNFIEYGIKKVIDKKLKIDVESIIRQVVKAN